MQYLADTPTTVVEELPWGSASNPLVCVRERGYLIREALEAANCRVRRAWSDEAEAVFVEVGHATRLRTAREFAEELGVPLWRVAKAEDDAMGHVRFRQLDREWVRAHFPPGVLGAYLGSLDSEVTRRGYATYLSRFAAFCRRLGVSPLEVGVPTLIRYRDQVRTKVHQMGWSTSTFAQHITPVRCLVRWLRSVTREPGLPTEDELDAHFAVPQVVNGPPSVATPSDVVRMLEAAGDDLRLRAALTLLYCGLRRQEVVELRTEQVQERGFLEDKPLYVMHVIGKGTRSRWVPLPASGHQRLSKYLEESGRTWSSRGPLLVFRNGKGEPNLKRGISAGHLGNLVRDLATRCEVDLTPHSLRHGFAHLFFGEYGHSLEALKMLGDVLGHKDSRTTLQYLSRVGYGVPVSPDVLAEPDSVAASIGPGPPPDDLKCEDDR